MVRECINKPMELKEEGIGKRAKGPSGWMNEKKPLKIRLLICYFLYSNQSQYFYY